MKTVCKPLDVKRLLLDKSLVVQLHGIGLHMGEGMDDAWREEMSELLGYGVEPKECTMWYHIGFRSSNPYCSHIGFHQSSPHCSCFLMLESTPRAGRQSIFDGEIMLQATRRANTNKTACAVPPRTSVSPHALDYHCSKG